ncbi:MAG: SET domain-containing protein-lysine N-methyltransferase [Edaphocola sp.]
MPIVSPKNLFIKESTIPGAGLGLFTSINIEKGTRIIRYTGRESTWAAADHQDGLNAYIYFMDEDFVIDASKRKKSLGRYANDARGLTRIKGIANNSIYVEDGRKVYIEASKNIAAGSEILVSYGAEYWKVLKKNYADLALEQKEQAEVAEVLKKK